MTPSQPSAEPLQYEDASPPIPGKDEIAYETVSGLDHDVDLGFQLRGHSYNALVDAATPLFGLALRLRGMESYTGDVKALYERVHHQIAAIDEEMRQLGYDHSRMMAYRYCLCTFLDEAVMATTWGAESIWAQRSLLSAHHRETWGGEKFFTLLSRMSSDPENYRDLLEFLYVCLCLGFKGKYMLEHNGQDELQRLIQKLHRSLRALRGDAPEALGDAQANVVPRDYRHGRSLPWWTPWAAAGAVLVAAYLFYAFRLGLVSSEVLRALDQVLVH